jgi:hypothetical protein
MGTSFRVSQELNESKNFSFWPFFEFQVQPRIKNETYTEPDSEQVKVQVQLTSTKINPNL